MPFCKGIFHFIPFLFYGIKSALKLAMALAVIFLTDCFYSINASGFTFLKRQESMPNGGIIPFQSLFLWKSNIFNFDKLNMFPRGKKEST
jgi:hypothetical protein